MAAKKASAFKAVKSAVARATSRKNMSTPTSTSAAASTQTGAEEPAMQSSAEPPRAATEAAGKKTVGKKAAGKKTAGKKSAAKKTAGKKTAAKKTAGKKSAAKKTAGKKTAGKKTAAKKAAGSTTAGKKAAGKKTTAKKAARRAAGKLAVRPGERAWTGREIAEVRKTLESDATRLRAEIAGAEVEIGHLLRDGGEGAGNDQADVGSSTFERDHEMTMAKNARENLAQVESALSRIDDGTYGICTSCGQPVGKMRLQAFPRATLCMECKQRQERR